MKHPPEPTEIISRFEKLLVALAASQFNFTLVGGLAVIFNDGLSYGTT
jgi:hypothetical protein